MTQDTLENLRARLAQFAADRDWEKFHSPKNLSMALIGEAAELVEHFQWLTQDESRQLKSKQLDEARLEMADILIYLIRIADQLDIDLVQAAWDKIAINEQRFPPEKVHGRHSRGQDLE